MATNKQFLFPAAVVYVAVTCLVLLFWSSFRQSSVATPCSQLSGNNNTGGEAVTDVMRLLHGNVERVLIDGQLPVDPRENTSWSLWSSDPPGSPCHEYKTRFGKRLPPVWLSSFPCSGNTWTRYLLEGASGVFTGSIYDDKTLRKKGYLGEHDSVTGMRTLVQKIHTIPPCKRKALKCPANNRTIPAVLLLRNPAKAIISFYKFEKTKSHTKQIPVTEFQTKEFHSFASKNIRVWREIALDRLLRTEAPLHVMHYERLVQDPITELTGLLAFLGVPRDACRMACIASHLEGSFKRKGNAPLDPYTAAEKAVMTEEEAVVNRTLLMMGYSPLPTYH